MPFKAPKVDADWHSDQWKVTIATNYQGEPLFGEPIVKYNGKRQRRVLLGWTHNNDNPTSLLNGTIWGWASGGSKCRMFQIYDTSFNRSTIPGELRICGPANFTMVRMWHPYWCPGGRIPKDMFRADKCELIDLYDKLLWGVHGEVVVDKEVDDDDQPNPSNAAVIQTSGASIIQQQVDVSDDQNPLFFPESSSRGGRKSSSPDIPDSRFDDLIARMTAQYTEASRNSQSGGESSPATSVEHHDTDDSELPGSSPITSMEIEDDEPKPSEPSIKTEPGTWANPWTIGDYISDGKHVIDLTKADDEETGL